MYSRERERERGESDREEKERERERMCCNFKFYLSFIKTKWPSNDVGKDDDDADEKKEK